MALTATDVDGRRLCDAGGRTVGRLTAFYRYPADLDAPWGVAAVTTGSVFRSTRLVDLYDARLAADVVAAGRLPCPSFPGRLAGRQGGVGSDRRAVIATLRQTRQVRPAGVRGKNARCRPKGDREEATTQGLDVTAITRRAVADAGVPGSLAFRVPEGGGVGFGRVQPWIGCGGRAHDVGMTSDVAVLAEDLTKFYGSRRGIDGLDLEVYAGEVMGFLGPNGAGKTTTIRLLLDFLRPTRGRAAVLGLDPRRDKAALHRQVGYLPGELAFPGRERASELLRFFSDARGGVAWSQVTDLADRLELDLSRPVRTMSKGNKQKVGLVQAFMHQPALLVLDEPTSGLDPLMQQEFLAMVRDARTAGQTVFMSSHVLAEVQQIADRVAIVRDGRLAAVERVESLGRRAIRSVEIHFDDPVDAAEFRDLPGVSEVMVSGPILRCTVDGRLDPLIKAAARHVVVDLLSAEPDLEETFLSFYYHAEGAAGAAGTRA